MNAAIVQLEIYLDTLKNNRAINIDEGNTEQADLQANNISEVESALKILKQ